MKRTDQKSHCAVNFALEAIGDPWSLLIVRDIVFNGKHTFNEFLQSEERIARNILASRLVQLESYGIVQKQSSIADKRVTLYTVTEKGVALIPVLCALSNWSVAYDPLTEANMEFAKQYAKDPVRMTQVLQAAARQGRAAFRGQNNVLHDLGISQ